MSERRSQLAVAVVLHESRDLLPRLLAGLRAQTRPADRLVFCLNGADDGARADLLAAAPEAILIERPENPGFAGGMNACHAAAADCDLFFMLNPDVVLEPDHLERLERLLAETPRAGGAAGLLIGEGEGGREVIDSSGFVTQPWLRIVDRAAGRADLGAFRERESVLGICAAAALFRNRALVEAAEEGRILDEDFFMYKEDQDLCLRLRAAGWRLYLEPRARAHHARGWRYGARRQVPLRLRRHSLKNRYLLLAKHWRWRDLGWTLPFVLAFEILLFLGLLLREPRTILAYPMAARLLPRALARRRALIERTRGVRDGPRPIWAVAR